MCDTVERIPDGVYFVGPDGGGWHAYRFRGGVIVDRTEESLATTHDAANDHWAGIRPSDDDDLLDVTDEPLSVAVARACGWDDPEGVSVSRPAADDEG